MFRTTKSQLSVEFVIIIFFAMLLFSFTLYAYFQQSNAVTEKKEMFIAKEIVQTVVSNANLAYLYSSTCDTTFYVSSKINDKNYTLNHMPSSHLLSISWDDSFYSFPLINSNITINTTVKNSYYVNCTGGIAIE